MTASTFTICTGQHCRRQIRWVVTLAGKRMPLDIDASSDGTVVVETRPDGTLRGRVLTGAELPAQGTAYRPHWQTCPDSALFRQQQARTTPICAICRGPMDPVLARRERWVKHPSCDAPRPASTTGLPPAKPPAPAPDELPGLTRDGAA